MSRKLSRRASRRQRKLIESPVSSAHQTVAERSPNLPKIVKALVANSGVALIVLFLAVALLDWAVWGLDEVPVEKKAIGYVLALLIPIFALLWESKRAGDGRRHSR